MSNRKKYTPRVPGGRSRPRDAKNDEDAQSAADPQDQPAPADRERDRRLADELTKKAGDVLALHRNGATAIESEADGVPEDDDQLADAAAREAEEDSPQGEDTGTRD